MIKNNIYPSIEHLESIKKIDQSLSLIDCGCNRGQFFTLFHYKKKITNLLCFDPLIIPKKGLNLLQKKDVRINFKKVALSKKISNLPFYVSTREDSSSLKRIKNNAVAYFPDVKFKKRIFVDVKTLDDYSELISNLPKPISLKLDVQGSELDLLLGAQKVLKFIKYIFIEINNISIYEIDSNFKQIFDLLIKNGFEITLKYNKIEVNKTIISYDYLFTNKIK